jgi:hypothetical protein
MLPSCIARCEELGAFVGRQTFVSGKTRLAATVDQCIRPPQAMFYLQAG